MFRPLNEHYEEGGSFRHLIYGRMGFDRSAYGVLCGQGMNLSNLDNCARRQPRSRASDARLLSVTGLREDTRQISSSRTQAVL